MCYQIYRNAPLSKRALASCCSSAQVPNRDGPDADQKRKLPQILRPSAEPLSDTCRCNPDIPYTSSDITNVTPFPPHLHITPAILLLPPLVSGNCFACPPHPFRQTRKIWWFLSKPHDWICFFAQLYIKLWLIKEGVQPPLMSIRYSER